MKWVLYVRKGTVYVPTIARTDAGYYLEIDPVEVASASNGESLLRAVKQAIARGNPRVATPTRATFPRPVVLKYANVKSWAAFEKEASCWEIYEKDGTYQIKQLRKQFEGGWVPDGMVEYLPVGSTLDQVAHRVCVLIQSGDTLPSEP